MYNSAHEEIEAFNRRQAEDMKRFSANVGVRRRKRFQDRFELANGEQSDSAEGSDASHGSGADDGEESWKNSEGERLRDFGVDEEIEFYDEEDIPLAVLIQQQRQRRQR